MLSNIINPLILSFTLTTAFGVMVHDTQLDRAATIAVTVPAMLATYAAIDNGLKSSDAHVHVERAHAPKNINSLRSTLPRLQPRDDDRRYNQTKKLVYTGGGDASLWPSV